MKKNIHNVRAPKNIKKNVLKSLFSFVLIFTLVFTLPIGFSNVYAAPLEDCDLDGYDDATGVPVPWPGYDETKGDTPDGPGGGSSSKPSTGDGSTSNPSSGNTSNPSSGSTGSPSSGGGTVSPSSGSTSNPSSGSTGSTSSTSSGNASDAPSGSANSSASTEPDGQDTVPEGDNEETSSSDEDLGSVTAAAEDVESVINTKGSLEIVEENGGIIHAGSSVIISGSGFSGNIDALEIEIHSKPQYLGSVTSSEDGSFEAQINIPEDLEAGKHNIVVLYQGVEIARQQIEVGPKAVGSFWEALTVGFSADNAGLIPGLSILAGLIILGLVTLLGGRIVRPRQNNSVS